MPLLNFFAYSQQTHILAPGFSKYQPVFAQSFIVAWRAIQGIEPLNRCQNLTERGNLLVRAGSRLNTLPARHTEMA